MYISYILNRVIFLFVCSELIEKLVRAIDLKFGRGVGILYLETSSNI